MGSLYIRCITENAPSFSQDVELGIGFTGTIKESKQWFTVNVLHTNCAMFETPSYASQTFQYLIGGEEP